MKKHLFILFSTLFIFQLKSQVIFCPPGAEWRYSFFVWPISWVNYKVTYIKDSLDGAEKIKQLTATGLFRVENDCLSALHPLKVYTKQKGDTVFFKHDRTPGWQILYNFAAGVGQLWNTTVVDSKGNPMNYTFVVDSISSVNINQIILKKMVLKMFYFGGSEKMVVVERFGNMGFLFNFEDQYCSSDPDRFESFLCYKDSTFGNKQFTSLPCDYSDKVSVEEIRPGNKGFVIFPNPSNDNLTIKLGDFPGDGQLQLSDAVGRVIKSQNVNAPRATFDVSKLSSGIYILNLINWGQIVDSKKIIIDR